MFKNFARPLLLAATVIGLGLAATAPAMADAERQALVNDATKTATTLITGPDFPDVARLLPRAKAVVIFPNMVQAGFIVGGAGGRGVMLVRTGPNRWSYPAFYFLGAGSVGFQIGAKVSESILIVLTDKGLNALLQDKFKFGAEAGVTVVSLGAGVGGSTTTAAGADIVAYAKSVGLFAGGALEGSYVSPDSDWNKLYYGGAPTNRSILFDGRFSNPGAEPLRSLLSRY
ncbi:MAG: lipid-binding SYLF domain-containing protein [Rhodospirillales bacterium]